jgi:predicted dithiol-disulfide oxidoreductase (DUF899 family)
LKDLFGEKKQLIVYHFMFKPTDDVGCRGCSQVGEHIPDLRHIRSRNTAFVCVSRASPEKLEAFKAKTGWTFPWYSSGEGDFNYDFQATIDDARGEEVYNYLTKDERKATGKQFFGNGDYPGMSVFYQEGGQIYHTYSTYERGSEFMLTTLRLLDLTPLGRQDEPGGPAAFKFNFEYEEGV